MTNALNVAGIIFGLVGFLHIMRLCFMIKITIGKKTVSMNASIIAFIVSISLSVWMFIESGVL